MKKLIMITLTMIALIVAPVLVFGQADDIIVPEFDFDTYFASLGGVMSLVVLITSGLKSVIEIKKPWVQVISWIISIVLCFVGFIFKIGLFTAIDQWWVILIMGFGIGLAANGFSKIETVRAILRLFKLLKK